METGIGLEGLPGSAFILVYRVVLLRLSLHIETVLVKDAIGSIDTLTLDGPQG